MAEGKGKGSSDDELWGKVAIGAAALAVIGVVVIPATLGYGLYMAGRRWLGQRENLLLVGISLAGLVWKAHECFYGYAAWLGRLAHGELTLATIPWLALSLMALLVAGTLGIIGGSAAVTKFDKVLRPKGTTVRSGKVKGTGSKAASAKAAAAFDESIDALPELAERTAAHGRAKIATPPGGALTVHATSHSVLAPEEPGKRTFPIGISLAGQPVMLSENEIRTHGLILGATGSGKSETIKALAGCLLDLGWSGIVIDLKEDTGKGGLRDWCFDYSTYHSTPFQQLCLSDPNSETWFNPLSGMGPDEMRDTVLSLNEFEAAYYEALNKELLGQLVNLMTWAHQADPSRFPSPTMYEMAKICGSSSLPAATKVMRAIVLQTIPGVTEADFQVLSSPSKAQAESATGFGSRLGNLYDTQAGRIILRPGNTPHGIPRRMLDITVSGLTYVGLDSQGKADLTRVISSSLLQRLSVYASQRTTGAVAKDKPRFVIIDEANWINRQITQNLLSRARGAGISMWLCTQGPKDWIDQTGDDWGKLTNNINVAIIMRQGEPESAELCAEYLGKAQKQTVSEKVSQTRGALVTRRERDEQGRIKENFDIKTEIDYRFSPDQLRELSLGEAIVRVGAPSLTLRYAKILMRDPKASPHRG